MLKKFNFILHDRLLFALQSIYAELQRYFDSTNYELGWSEF